MQWTENKVTYDTVDSYVLKNIPGFSEYYYLLYDDSDRGLKFEVFGSLTDFFNDLRKKNNEPMTTLIIDKLYKLYILGDKELQELICTGFIENLIEADRGDMLALREVLKYPELQKCLEELYSFWYGEEL